MKALSFQCLKLLFKKSEKARKFFDDNGLIVHVNQVLSLSIATMKQHRHSVTNKKKGAKLVSLLEFQKI